MLSKNDIKYYSSLLQKKFRREYGKFLVEGRKLVIEAFNSGFECEIIISTNKFNESNPDILDSADLRKVRWETVKQMEFDKLTDTKSPQGIIGIFKIPSKTKISSKGNIVVALESISDPGNLGTILRNCDWFGIQNVILNESCAEIFNPKVIRASAGSVFHLKIYESKNFIDSITELKNKGFKIVTADLNGENIYEYDRNEKSIIVFANEANGPSMEVLSVSDSKITIPQKGKAESLNVASASAVILSEMTK